MTETHDCCVICGEIVENYKPDYCCNETDCGCGGRPIEPPVCSDKCWKIINKDMEIIIEDDGQCGYNCPYFNKINDCDAVCLFTNEDIIYYDGYNANCIRS